MPKNFEMILHSNPDALSLEEVREFHAEIVQARTELDFLRRYLMTKSQAMSHRLEGSIPTAQVHEQACEQLYKQLPKWLRW